MIDAPRQSEPVDQLASVSLGRRSARQHFSVGDSIVRGALANFSMQPLTWAATLVAATFVPRFLGSDALGQLTVAFAMSSLAGAAFDLGILNLLTRRIAQNSDGARRDLGVALLVQAVTYLGGALAIGLLAPLIAPSLLDVRILYMALATLVLLAAQSLVLTGIRAQEQHVQFAWLRAIPWIVGPFATVFDLVVGGDVVAYMAV